MGDLDDSTLEQRFREIFAELRRISEGQARTQAILEADLHRTPCDACVKAHKRIDDHVLDSAERAAIQREHARQLDEYRARAGDWRSLALRVVGGALLAALLAAAGYIAALHRTQSHRPTWGPATEETR